MKHFLIYGSIVLPFMVTLIVGCKPEQEITKVTPADKDTAKEVSNKMVNKKVVMIIAENNFRDEEYFEPKKILSNAGIEITTASSGLNEATGMLGGKVRPDILFSDIRIDEYDAVILVGGMGANEYWDNRTAHNIINDAIGKNKIVAAICIAPVTLAHAGVLKNKKATVFISEKSKIISKGAKYAGEGVHQDGLIVTASGPNYASQFGTKLKQLLLFK